MPDRPESYREFKEIMLEGIFQIMYYGGFTYTESRSLPISYRRWFIARISKEFADAKNKDGTTDHMGRGAHQNDAQTRAIAGKNRAEGPTRTRRFT